MTFPTLPSNWRSRLPNPTEYYREHIPDLGQADALGTVRGRCPMHVGGNPVIALDAGGGWRCFGKCGGGDVVEFAARLRAFNDAVRSLIGDGA